MPFTHHSHSGQFCGHATNTLAEVLAAAVSKRMSVFSMTEHIPRSNKDLYPGELDSGMDEKAQQKLFAAYVAEARRLRQEHEAAQQAQSPKDRCEVLIGFETEWIRENETAEMVEELLRAHEFDFFVGSVHHVNTIPIDFDKKLYDAARREESSEEYLFQEYFRAQRRMLTRLRPKIVGHFDLIRLFSRQPDRSWQSFDDPAIWELILDNLRIIRDYRGLLEINSAALRKGLAEPYPRSEICKAFIDMGGDFVLSDDSHGVGHIGTNYDKIPEFLDKIGLERIAYLQRQDGLVRTMTMSVEEFKKHRYWTASASTQ